MTKYIGRIFQDRFLVDTFTGEMNNFNEFVATINENHPIIKKYVDKPLMVHAYPAGEYKGIDKIIYFGDYPNKKF